MLALQCFTTINKTHLWNCHFRCPFLWWPPLNSHTVYTNLLQQLCCRRISHTHFTLHSSVSVDDHVSEIIPHHAVGAQIFWELHNRVFWGRRFQIRAHYTMLPAAYYGATVFCEHMVRRAAVYWRSYKYTHPHTHTHTPTHLLVERWSFTKAPLHMSFLNFVCANV